MQSKEDRNNWVRPTELAKQILVVEDEGLIAADIQKRLERLGYPLPTIASSGEEALNCARSTPFDLVLMDIRLKGTMDGIATAAVLKTELETPVVYMTALADQETVNRAILTDPFGFILKPITDGDLRNTVSICIHKQEMEGLLRTSEAWLSATLGSLGEGLITTNTTGHIVFMNHAAEQLTGWSGSDAHGHMLMDVLGLFEESTGWPAKNPIIDRFPRENSTYSLISKTGEQTIVEVQCFENRSAGKLLGSIVVVRDITSRRDTERRLIQAQRMEAIASVAGGLAHDFSDQLTAILGYASQLCSSLSGHAQEQALNIRQAASIASSIAGQLLTLSRHDVTRPEALNVNELIGEVEPLISPRLGESRTLTTHLGSPVGLIRADRNQIKQVLLNLALRALDALPAVGKLRIESSTLEITAGSLEARLYRQGPFVRLLVSDTGKAMSDTTLARVFEPSLATQRVGIALDLGLSIVHSIIVQSEGYVTATSEAGKGTIFEILLPWVGTAPNLSSAPVMEREGLEVLQASSAKERNHAGNKDKDQSQES